MSIVKLKNGKTKFITNEYDFRELILEELGAEAEYEYNEIVLNEMNNLREQADYTKQKIHTDLEAYESELELFESELELFSGVMRDILDFAKGLENYIEETGIANKHRIRILKDLKSIRTEINNCI